MCNAFISGKDVWKNVKFMAMSNVSNYQSFRRVSLAATIHRNAKASTKPVKNAPRGTANARCRKKSRKKPRKREKLKAIAPRKLTTTSSSAWGRPSAIARTSNRWSRSRTWLRRNAKNSATMFSGESVSSTLTSGSTWICKSYYNECHSYKITNKT